MKNCIKCANVLTEEADYCYVCQTGQGGGKPVPQYKPASGVKTNIAITVLATILFVVATIGKMMADSSDSRMVFLAVQAVAVLLGIVRFAGGGKAISGYLDRHDNSYLQILCAITIIGAMIRLLPVVGLTYSLGGEGGNMVLYLWMIMPLLKLTGAILMLMKHIIGLYIYTVGAVGVMADSLINGRLGSLHDMELFTPVLIIAFYSAFLYMYWSERNRKLLH